MQFCSISRKRVYNDALQDQSSSHLSAVLEIPDRYSATRRSCFVPRLFVCVRALCSRMYVYSSSPSLLFPDFYSRLSHFRGGDDARVSCVSRWLFEVIEGGFPGWCKLNRKRLLGLYIFQRDSPTSSVIRESSFCLGFFSGRCPFFWRASPSIGKFIRSRDSRQTKVTACT